jgi:dolichol-phosphate mannosyltransferase
MKLSVVIPARDEEGSIEQLVNRLFNTLPNAEIIIVNDHSTKKTEEIVKKLKRKYRNLRLIKNTELEGKTSALLLGFSSAKGEIIGMVDADLQYPPEALSEMVKLIEENRADVVIAKRIFKEVEFVRRFLSAGYTFIFGRFLLGIPATDIQTGEKVFKREVLESIKIQARRWGFDTEFLYKAHKKGFRIAEVPIIFSRREKGKSKVSLFQTICDLAITTFRLLPDRILR